MKQPSRSLARDPRASRGQGVPRSFVPCILVTGVGEAEGSRAAAAALACALSEPEAAALFIDLGGRTPRPTLLATPAARDLEGRLQEGLPGGRVAARGRACHLALPQSPSGLGEAATARRIGEPSAVVVHLPLPLLEPALRDDVGLGVSAVLLRADLRRDRAAMVRTLSGLRGRGLAVGVLKRRLDWASERRALFGTLASDSPGALPARLVARLAARSDAARRAPDGEGVAYAPRRGCRGQGSGEPGR